MSSTAVLTRRLPRVVTALFLISVGCMIVSETEHWSRWFFALIAITGVVSLYDSVRALGQALPRRPQQSSTLPWWKAAMVRDTWAYDLTMVVPAAVLMLATVARNPVVQDGAVWAAVSTIGRVVAVVGGIVAVVSIVLLAREDRAIDASALPGPGSNETQPALGDDGPPPPSAASDAPAEGQAPPPLSPPVSNKPPTPPPAP